MQIPDFENAMKWREFWSKFSFRRKFVYVILIIAFVFLFLFLFVHYRGLGQKNSELKDEVAKLQTEKAELHRENLHLKEMVGPIQEITKRLYPDLETMSAIAKLTKDMENVRALVTREVYRPLAKERQEKLIAGLKALYEEYSTISPSVLIWTQQGSSVREKVSADLKKYFQQAGWNVDIRNAMILYSGESTPVISVKCHPEDKQFLQKIIDAVIPIFIDINVTKKVDASVGDTFSRGHLEIKVIGDPLFNESGVVTFK